MIGPRDKTEKQCDWLQVNIMFEIEVIKDKLNISEGS